MKKADRRQLEGLYDRYEQLIYRVAYGVLKSVEQAEDVTQETFIQLYHNLPTLKKLNESDTKRYILKIAKNKAIDYYRKNQKQHDFLSQYQHSQGISEDNVASKVNELISEEQMVKLLKILPTSYQNVFMYRLYYGLSTREVAELTALSEANVRKQYERAKKKIISTIGGAEDDNIRETLAGIS